MPIHPIVAKISSKVNFPLYHTLVHLKSELNPPPSMCLGASSLNSLVSFEISNHTSITRALPREQIKLQWFQAGWARTQESNITWAHGCGSYKEEPILIQSAMADRFMASTSAFMLGIIAGEIKWLYFYPQSHSIFFVASTYESTSLRLFIYSSCRRSSPKKTSNLDIVGMGRRSKRKGKRNNSFQNALGKADLVLHAKQGEKWNYCAPLSLKAPESSAEISGPKSRSGPDHFMKSRSFHGIRDHHLAHFLKATIVPPWCSPCG